LPKIVLDEPPRRSVCPLHAAGKIHDTGKINTVIDNHRFAREIDFMASPGKKVRKNFYLAADSIIKETFWRKY
jgi:hypothetical protein